MPTRLTRQQEIEKLAALTLAPLVEIAWADGQITPGERQSVLEAAKAIGLDQHSEFCKTTLQRWLYEAPPTAALERWRALLAPTLAEAETRIAGKAERRLLETARNVAKADERAFIEGGTLDAQAGITPEEARVLDELAAALSALDDEPA
jgi:tellurite resistance protein